MLINGMMVCENSRKAVFAISGSAAMSAMGREPHCGRRRSCGRSTRRVLAQLFASTRTGVMCAHGFGAAASVRVRTCAVRPACRHNGAMVW